MSKGFNILIWPGGSRDPIALYKEILRLVAGSDKVRERFTKFTIYREQRPSEYGGDSKDPHIVANETLDAETTIDAVLTMLNQVQDTNIHVHVHCVYDRWSWNNDICDNEPSSGWLSVEYSSASFWGGTEYKMLGPYRVYFDNIYCFSPHVIDFEKCVSPRPDVLTKLSTYGENVRFVEKTFKNLASEINPVHMMVVTEGDCVNPLNFHMVYHARLTGYLFDLRKILQLHNRGGGYFYEGLSMDFDKPYRSLTETEYGSPYQDSIRNHDRARELFTKLNFFADVITDKEIDELHLPDEEILEVITSYSDTEVGEANGNIYLMHSNFLFGYLDATYLRL